MDALKQTDPDIHRLLVHEAERQEHQLEMIASENFVSQAVLQAAGSVLTNKYAEGYPGKRYYGGCEVVDEVEKLAQERVLQLFGAEHANVQPHSGAQANMAVFFALLEPGDTMLGRPLPESGTISARLDADGSASTRGESDLLAEGPGKLGESVRLVLGE